MSNPTTPPVAPAAPAAPAAAAPAGGPAAAPTAPGAAANPTDPKAGSDATQPANCPTGTCPLKCPRCHANITEDQLKKIFPKAPADRISGAVSAFNDAFEKFGVNKCLRKAHYFAQVRQETGADLDPNEGMNYSTKRMNQVWPSLAKQQPDITQYTTDGATPNQQAFADRAYAGKLGNGNVASGDGWNYRGRGDIGLTGKSNYAAVQKEIDALDPGSGVNIVTDHDVISTPKGAMISGLGFWALHNLSAKADGGDAGSVVDSITAVINKATDSYAARRANYNVTKVVFMTAQCLDRNKPTPTTPAKGAKKKPTVTKRKPAAKPAAKPAK